MESFLAIPVSVQVLSVVPFLTTPPLQVLSVVSFRTGGFEAIFTWEESSGYGYWGLWVRQLGSMVMMFPILLVPVTGLIQAIRFVRSGDGDLYDVSGPGFGVGYLRI